MGLDYRISLVDLLDQRGVPRWTLLHLRSILVDQVLRLSEPRTEIEREERDKLWSWFQ